MRNVRVLIWLIAIAAGFSLISYAARRPPRVRVIRPIERVVTETLAASGEVRGQWETNVGAQTGGRVTAILVREGDTVATGQTIARINDDVLRTETMRAEAALRTAEVGVIQAMGAVQSARANLALAARRPLASEVARIKAEATQSVAVAEAKVAAARQRLAELERGATDEQRDQIAAQVAQAEVTLQKAGRDAERRRRLFNTGVMSRAEAEDAETARDTARKSLENLAARQREILAGPRQEQRDQAKADLLAAIATRDGACATGEAQIHSLLAQPRPEDVAVAQARLMEAEQALLSAKTRREEARVALEAARERVKETIVTAPFAGTVTSVVTEVGGIAGPSQALVKLVRTRRPEIRVNIDEDNLGRLYVGQEARITAEAFPGKQIMAAVRRIGAEVDASKGQVEVRLDPKSAPSWLRPGQTVTVNLILDRGSRRLTLPITAIATSGNIPQVLVLEGKRAVKKRIEIGATGPEGVVVKSGITASSQVISDPNAVADNTVVEVERS